METIFEKTVPYLEPKIWGGSLLESLKSAERSQIGESFEVSSIKEKECKVGGVNISTLISTSQLPYLVKLIDTADNLSVQTHPGDEYAERNENSLGKTECWLILDARPGSGIFLGFKQGVTRESFFKMIDAKEDLTSSLNFHTVKNGDFFYVPAGSVHAIGAGVSLLEVQQNSGITYRVWDWNRIDREGKSRELHINKAFDVLNFKASENTEKHFCVQKKMFEHIGNKKLIEHQDFKVEIISKIKNYKIEIGEERLATLVCLEGDFILKSEIEELKLEKFESAVILNRKVSVISNGLCTFALIS